MSFFNCPRCGDQSYEKLRSHDHCFNCNYSSEFESEFDPPIPSWAKNATVAKSSIVDELFERVERLKIKPLKAA